jgi:cell shape-determining protein MreC
MDSQRFVQILQETIRSQNQIMYNLCSHVHEVKNFQALSSSLSSLQDLHKENQKLKEELEDLKSIMRS